MVPTLSGQDIVGAFDAFTYAAHLTDDAALARQLQPFLAAYPASLHRAALPIYALCLHSVLLAAPLLGIKKALGRKGLIATVAALSIPESAMFLGSISKEGLGIVAVVAAISGQALYLNGKKTHGTLMCIYAIAVAEFSRPLYGFPFAAALLVGFLPILSVRQRYTIYVALCTAAVVGGWAILAGPFAAEFTEKYQTAKQFLDWFEREMGSDSLVKSSVRGFFALAFNGEEPSLSLLILITFAAIGKAIVYAIAIPLIAPAAFNEMPAQTWALTWQVAASATSIAIIASFFKIRSKHLSIDDQCRFYLGIALLFIISISTAFFHVRYRAPAVVVILMATWLIKPEDSRSLFWMNTSALLAAGGAIASTM